MSEVVTGSLSTVKCESGLTLRPIHLRVNAKALSSFQQEVGRHCPHASNARDSQVFGLVRCSLKFARREVFE